MKTFKRKMERKIRSHKLIIMNIHDQSIEITR